MKHVFISCYVGNDVLMAIYCFVLSESADLMKLQITRNEELCLRITRNFSFVLDNGIFR